MTSVILESVLTCPKCGFESREQMPEDACVHRFTCESCGADLRPLPTDCCVFCSFGSVPCPPKQKSESC